MRRFAFPMIDLTTISRNLEETAEGVWCCRSLSTISYPEWGNEACFHVEDSSFWFRHRNACILEAVRQYPPSGALFDVGGGNGFVAKSMQDSGMEVVLVEPGAVGAANARRRGIQYVVRATLEDAGFFPDSLPAISLFDVVEHMEDDRRFLETIRFHLSANGRVYLTVPAYQSLWSLEDIVAGHHRRYSSRAIRELLVEAGFAVEFLTGFFQFLTPAIFALRVIPFRLGLGISSEADEVGSKIRGQHEIKSGWISGPLNWIQQREVMRIRRRRQARFGASWLVVARKAR
jgi:SAM-dependent methyltransferase